MGSTAKCRVCGKEYTPCRTIAVNGVFRWQAVACSPECGAEYLKRIEASRSPKKIEGQHKRGKRTVMPLIDDNPDISID